MIRLSRVAPVTLLAAVIGGLLSGPAEGAATKSLLIAVDGLRADAVDTATTPHLMRLIRGELGGGAYRTAFSFYAHLLLAVVWWSCTWPFCRAAPRRTVTDR